MKDLVEPSRVARVLLRDSGWHAVQPGTFRFHGPGDDGWLLANTFSFREDWACGGHRVSGARESILALAERMPPETIAQLEQQLFAENLPDDERTRLLVGGAHRLHAENKITLDAMREACARWAKKE